MEIIHRLRFFTLIIITLLLGLALVLSVYSTIQAFLGIQQSVIVWLKSVIYDQDKSSLDLIINLICLVILTLCSFMLYLSYSASLCSLFLSKTQGLKKALQWQIYKHFKVFMPLCSVLLITTAVIFFSIWAFNYILTISGVSLFLVVATSTFIGLNILIALIISNIHGLLQMIKMGFGTEITLDQPELELKTVENRSKSYPVNFSIIFIWTVFLALLALQLYYTNPSALLYVLFLNILSYTGIKYLKTSTYAKTVV